MLLLDPPNPVSVLAIGRGQKTGDGSLEAYAESTESQIDDQVVRLCGQFHVSGEKD